MNHYELVVEKDEKIVVNRHGQLATEDKFRTLVTTAPGAARARVNVGVSEALGYGALKVSCSVTLECDQNEKMVDLAGEYAFYKAVELMKDGFSIYGVEAGPK